MVQLWQPYNGREEEALLQRLHGLHSLASLRVLVPGLLRKELELAMDKLGLIHDRTYAWDIFSDMMRCQSRCAFPSAELPRPFTDSTRAILVDWLIQVHGVFHFSEETLYLAVHLLNRALRQIKISISNLQLLGMMSELCYLMDNSYSKQQLLRMERRVLAALYLARQVLQEVSTPESETAWCIATSLHVCSEPTLTRIMQILAVAASKAHNRETRATFLKFSIAETLHVSSHPALQRALSMQGPGGTQMCSWGGETSQYVRTHT
ncbi:hypothetical protein JZ751_002030 [Albula glossodonta]|uniref:Cyclin-like domain-containing protein n=1 Tax=Albula glossodonta TaxID=121402 RepID=A0A8T2P6V5_9TELE|nr:hypothetical protein JZ751_002030 [Albula glossodonta]